MPKSKKKKNADFQKVKLKVGKKLPKGQNETDLSFKSRQLYMPKTKDFINTDVPRTKRKVTLEELIKQCDANKSTSLRLSSVEGFRELLLSDAGRLGVLQNLHQVMVRVAGLLSDAEPTVRQAVLRLFKAILPFVESSAKRSFFDYLSAQLCCAMNHISDNVRVDAIALFDMLLEKFPQHVTDDYCKLIPHLVDQVSGQTSSKKKDKSGKAKSVFFNPDSRLLSRKWRSQTLQRLKKIVDIFVSKHKTEMAEKVEDEGECYHVRDLPVVRGPTVTSDARAMWTTWPKARPLNAEMQQYSQLHRNSDNLQQFISRILPLLKQWWLEEHLSEAAGSSWQNASEEGQQLREESLPMVQAIVGLLHSLVECWRCIHDRTEHDQEEKCWFRGEFLQQLRAMFLPHFPIHVALKAQKDKNAQSASQAAMEETLLKLNLQVCEALASFPPTVVGWPRPTVEAPREAWHKVILAFMLKNLKRCSGTELAGQSTAVLRPIFFNFPPSVKLENLLSRAQERFIKSQPLSVEKKTYLHLLEDLAFDLDLASPYDRVYKERHTSLQPFLESLPELLLAMCAVKGGETITRQLLKVLSCPCISPLLAKAMDSHMVRLLDAERGVFAKLPSSCHGEFVQALKCTYRKMAAPSSVLDKVETVLRLPHISDDVAEQLLTGVHQEYGSVLSSERYNDDCRKDYFRFFFGVLVGHSSEEIMGMQKENVTQKRGLNHIIWQTDRLSMRRHQLLVKKCVGCFGSVDLSPRFQPSVIMSVVAGAWKDKILSEFQTLNIHTVYGALMHWNQMVSPLREGEILHIDNDACPWTDHLGPEIWTEYVATLLPVIKQHLRLFSKLTFSVTYSLVSMETHNDVVAADVDVVKIVWEAVVLVLRCSLRIFVDMCNVAVEFLQYNGSEHEARKVTQALTKLLCTDAMSDHKDQYAHHVTQALQSFSLATLVQVPSVAQQPWWQEFTETWL